ncbi:MAG: hypothetical protein Q8Q95_01180 [bacterium]|nr:hypothetical protein [bacterium]
MDKVSFKCAVCGNRDYESIGHSQDLITDDTFNKSPLYICTKCSIVFTNPAKFTLVVGTMPLSDKQEEEMKACIAEDVREEIQLSLLVQQTEKPSEHEDELAELTQELKLELGKIE